MWGQRFIDDLVLRDRGSERLYVLGDYFSPTAIADPSETVMERYGYNAFGLSRVMAPDFSSRSSSGYDWETRFDAYRWDAETGFYQVRYRYLHPNLGRWINRDPIEETGGSNLYAFVSNGTLTSTDPAGLDACKSDYQWIVLPVMNDRDLQSTQTITITTTVKIGTNSTNVPVRKQFSGLWGMTITEPSLIAGDCCCPSKGVYKPTFNLNVYSQIYLLDKRSSAWGAKRMNSGDPDVDEYWVKSPQFYRRQLVLNHEKKHQASGKKNYEKWKSDLQMHENDSYSSMEECLNAVNQTITQTTANFYAAESADSSALHNGGRQ
ncbi:MAG: RHS repeat-associated core domain-containing protein [Verrucomicrobia bacterium]|nr:RHS repeat-associated core domain-containing protein [Verrucomicrobiota bacterium]